MEGLFRHYVLDRKKETNVLILGPYRSLKRINKDKKSPCLSRLERIRKYMIDNGFKQTFLMINFKDEKGIPKEVIKEHFTIKSYWYISNWADICIFVFLNDCDNGGVEDELDHLCANVKHKIDTSAIVHPEKLVLTTLKWGKIKFLRIRHDPYEKNEEIEGLVLKSCFNILYSHIYHDLNPR